MIRINSDDASSIARLGGIRLRVAKRIVEYRKVHGYFRNAKDLASVKGIGLQLAVTLSPAIDWGMPSEVEGQVPRDWMTFLMLIAVAVITTIIYAHSCRYNFWPYLKANLSSHFHVVRVLGLGAFGFSVLGNLTFLSSIALSAAARMSTLRKTRLEIERAALKSIAIIVVFMVLVGLCQWGLYPYRPGGFFHNLLAGPRHLEGIVFFAVVITFGTPLILLLYLPSLALRAGTARVFDIWIAMFGVGSAILSILVIKWLPGVMRLVFGLQGGCLVWAAWKSATVRTSLYEAIEEHINLSRVTEAKSSLWMSWLNNHLPAPEEQKLLLQALRDAYPESPWQGFLRIVVGGAGAWLLLTMMASVVEWVVARILEIL